MPSAVAMPTLEVVRFIHNTNSLQIFWSRYTPYGTFSANRGSTAFHLGMGRFHCRLKWDDTASTVRGFWAPSPTGDSDWVALAAAESKASRPDFMGLILSDESGSTSLPQVDYDFFRVNWTPDFDPTA